MSRLVRSICAGVCGAAALLGSGGASAQAVVLYGLADVSASSVKPVGGETTQQLESGGLQQSFLGFRGTEDLGGGLRAVFKLESYVRFENGAVGRYGSDAFFSRESSVGLSGAFGTTLLGRTVTPMFLATVNFNPFGESTEFSPSTRQYFGPRGAMLGDSRWNSSVNYSNNTSSSALRLNAIGSVAPQGSGQPGPNWGGSAAYITGPFAATLVYEKIKSSSQPLPPGFERQQALQVGATYDFKFLRVYGQAGRVQTEADTDVQTILYQLGAAIPLSNSVILIAYGHSHVKTALTGTTDQIVSIGYDYFLSKSTDLYLAAMYEKLSFTSNGNSVAGGIRLRF